MSKEPDRCSVYPEWVCYECGAKYGRRLPTLATLHQGECKICGITKAVTEPRDFGHLKEGWHLMANETTDKQRKAREVAEELSKRGEKEAATTIQHLVDLAKAYQQINMAYRTGRRPTEKALDCSAELGFMIE
jgi:hypothetical protein